MQNKKIYVCAMQCRYMPSNIDFILFPSNYYLESNLLYQDSLYRCIFSQLDRTKILEHKKIAQSNDLKHNGIGVHQFLGKEDLGCYCLARMLN